MMSLTLDDEMMVLWSCRHKYDHTRPVTCRMDEPGIYLLSSV
jgi:hypothetical protein